MGGSIKIVVRTEKQTKIVTGWTNCLPDIFNQTKFLDGDPEVWDLYINYYENNPRCKREYASLLCPFDYGIFIIDYVNKTIYGCQNYCSPIWMSALWCEEVNEFLENERSNWFDTAEQIKKGILFFITYTEDSDKEKLEPINSIEELIKRRENENLIGIRRNINPWTYRRFEKTSKGLISLLKKLIANDFKICDKATELWLEQINEAQKNEQEK